MKHAMWSRRALVTGIMGLGACTTMSPEGAAQDKSVADGLSPGGALHSWLEAEVAKDRFSGVVLAAGDQGTSRIYAGGLADRQSGLPVRGDTRFNLASQCKMFTAVVIAQLAEQGRLAYSDKLSRHLPDFPRNVGDRVTIHHLLTHTAGLGDYFEAPRYEEIAPRVTTVDDMMPLVVPELAFEPGSEWRYSNAGYVLLGAIIEKLSGANYYDQVAASVFRPAGMASTGFPTKNEHSPDMAIGYADPCMGAPDCKPTTPADMRRMWPNRGGPAGGGWSTAGDLLGFVRALKAGKLVKPQTLTLMRTMHARAEAGSQYGYGYGFMLTRYKGREAFGHSGGTAGAQNQLETYTDIPLTLILLTNLGGALRPALAAARDNLIT